MGLYGDLKKNFEPFYTKGSSREQDSPKFSQGNMEEYEENQLCRSIWALGLGKIPSLPP